MSTEQTDKKVPLTREAATIRKSLVADASGKYNVNYNLILTIRRKNDIGKDEKVDFEGQLKATFTYHPKEENASQNLFLNFVGKIEKVSVNSTAVEKVEFENHRLVVPKNLLKADTENSIDIIFHGIYNHNGVGLHHYVDPSDQKEYLYTQFEPYDCNRLFPCFDQPDIKATLKLTVVAPEEWVVLGNEAVEEEKAFTNEEITALSIEEKAVEVLFKEHDILNKKYKIHKFKQTPRISTYLYALCAGRYVCIENKQKSPVPLRLFMKESLKTFGEPEEIFRVTIAGMEFYKNYFGIDYPFGKYDQIFCPEYNMGAMENVGLVTLNEFYCWKEKPTQRRRTGFAITILHELAHMWFGDLVTMKWWDDLWLNESFATFISHLCLSKSEELNKTYTISWVLFAEYKGSAFASDQLPTTHPVMSDVYDTEVAETHFDEIVYNKGSSMVKQMYYFIGDEIFSKGLKEYFKEFKWGNTIFDDFIGKMISVAGDKCKNLKELCKNWLQKAGLNEVSLDIEKDGSGNISKFVVNQKPCLESHPNLQTHKVDFLFIYDFKDFSANKVIKEQIIEPKPQTVFDFHTEKAPLVVFLNYNDWGYMKIVLDKTSIENLKTGLIHIKDPLLSQSIVRSLFDQVRDAKLSTLSYLDIVMPLLTDEEDDSRIGSLLRAINSACIRYLPLKMIQENKHKFFLKLIEKLTKELQKTPRSDRVIRQLIIYLQPAAFVDEDRKVLYDILEGKGINGIPIEDDLLSCQNRLEFVRGINLGKFLDDKKKEELLEREIKKDNNSDDSKSIKLICEAQKPDPEKKKELWDIFVNQSKKYSLYDMESLMRGFAPLEQYDLVKDYLNNKFFEDLPKVGKNNENFYINNFINYCSPEFYATDEGIKKMEELVGKVEGNAQLKRNVLESVDMMKRRQKAFKLCEQ